MIRGTTPTLELQVDDETLDLTQMNHVYVTLRNGTSVLTKQDEDLTIEGNGVALYLNQAETLAIRGHREGQEHRGEHLRELLQAGYAHHAPDVRHNVRERVGLPQHTTTRLQLQNREHLRSGGTDQLLQSRERVDYDQRLRLRHLE